MAGLAFARLDGGHPINRPAMDGRFLLFACPDGRQKKERQAPFLKTRRGVGQQWKLVVAMSHARPALWARATLSPMNA
jgi:hypothetical protein